MSIRRGPFPLITHMHDRIDGHGDPRGAALGVEQFDQASALIRQHGGLVVFLPTWSRSSGRSRPCRRRIGSLSVRLRSSRAAAESSAVGTCLARSAVNQRLGAVRLSRSDTDDRLPGCPAPACIASLVRH